VHSFVFDLFDVTPRLAILSPVMRCGKTRLLAVLGEVVHRPFANNISLSAFFRVVERDKPCLLIDEVDSFLRKDDDLENALISGRRD
jgi:putative DNA primase/helicase